MAHCCRSEALKSLWKVGIGKTEEQMEKEQGISKHGGGDGNKEEGIALSSSNLCLILASFLLLYSPWMYTNIIAGADLRRSTLAAEKVNKSFLTLHCPHRMQHIPHCVTVSGRWAVVHFQQGPL